MQAAPDLSIDLADLPHLTQVHADWSVIRDTISSLAALEEIITWRFDRLDLRDLRDLVHIRTLVIKDAPFLRTLDGVGTNPVFERLEVVGARRLEDIEDVESLGDSLQQFKLQSCRAMTSLLPVERLRRLRFLGFSDSGDLDSLSPLSDLTELRELYAWGTTRVLDGDLSPLFDLPLLCEVGMRDRRNYRPRLSTLKGLLDARTITRQT